MPDFTPLEIDVMRLLSSRAVRWLDLDHVVAGLEAIDGGSPHDRTRVLASLNYLVRARLVARCLPAGQLHRIYALTELGAAELAARDQLRLTA
jgi:hypothetical protein